MLRYFERPAGKMLVQFSIKAAIIIVEDATPFSFYRFNKYL